MPWLFVYLMTVILAICVNGDPLILGRSRGTETLRDPRSLNSRRPTSCAHPVVLPGAKSSVAKSPQIPTKSSGAPLHVSGTAALIGLLCAVVAICGRLSLRGHRSDGLLRMANPDVIFVTMATAVVPMSEQEIRRKHISDQEAALMERVRIPLSPPISGTSDPDTAAAILRRDGFVHLSGLLTPALCRELLEEINPRVELATARAALGGAAHRYDLLLPLEGSTYEAVQSALGPGGLTQVLDRMVGPEAFLAELGALVCDPGAIRQPVHPDTVSHGGAEQPIFSTFIALQDVTPAMGPTSLIPGTHNPAAHAAVCGIEHDSHKELLATWPNVDATLRCGDAVIFDSRIIHAGGANCLTSGRRRAILYVSVQRPLDGQTELPNAPERRTPPCAYSILRSYHNRFKLGDWRTWSVWR